MLKNIFNKKHFLIVILILVLTFNFMTNFLSKGNIGIYSFQDFQFDSERLVFGKIYFDEYEEFEGECNYGLCSYENINDTAAIKFNSYTSQVGLQGVVISSLKNIFNIPITGIYIILSLILSTVLFFISYFIAKKYDKLLGSIFYITFFLSPWIIAFARNLYWVTFTWFLPCLLGLLLSLNYNKKKIFIPLIFLAILLKCLCGYEYISTIMLSTIVFFIIDFFEEKDKSKKIKIFKTTLYVGIACLMAFFLALSIHGYMRGNGNVLEGVKTIYKNDVLRRTVITTDKDNYTGIMKESMDAKITDVLGLYFYNWSTDIIYGLDGDLFPLISFLALAICLINIINKKENNKRDIVMYIMFLLTTVSWFILGKSHSYIHTHMNFVLWYFGFIQICIYILCKFFIKKVTK